MCRDGGPVIPDDAVSFLKKIRINIKDAWKDVNYSQELVQLDSETIKVGDKVLKKPFVEKPVSGEDHNIWIYYAGGGVRKLFRKVANKASEFIPGVVEVRKEGSYVYEEFMDVDNSEDVKLYTVGEYTYAETRKSPVVDGIVRRTPDGKEMRQVCALSPEEQSMAIKVREGFGQTVCGLDLLRVNGKSYIIDVNGWSFVKGSDEYYDMCSKYLRQIFLKSRRRRPTAVSKDFLSDGHWKLKGFFSVLRHGDRTPKQKLKFQVTSQPFIDLLNGSVEEVLLKKPEEFEKIIEVAKKAKQTGDDNEEVLDQFLLILEKKISEPGTKVQVKPTFNKEDGLLEKIQVVVKWGGEFTHAGQHHTRDLGENLRKDLLMINKDVFQDVHVYSSSERRVLATCEVFLKEFLEVQSLPSNILEVRKDMLDDSYDAKEQMDEVKQCLQNLLNPNISHEPEESNPQGITNVSEYLSEVIGLLQSRREIMKKKFEVLDVNAIQKDWCCSESPQLFKERWDRLFKEVCDVDRSSFDTNKISELYDSLKYDALHNRQFIEEMFVNKSEEADPRAPLRELYQKTKALFDYIAPREYGITNEEKLEIGFSTSVLLLQRLIDDLNAAKTSEKPCIRMYFTKESHVHTLYNVIRLCFSPGIQEISELDYLTQITMELYERYKDNNVEYSIRVGFSPGANSAGLIDTQMDETHALAVAPRKWISDHINLADALVPLEEKLKFRQTVKSAAPKLEWRRKK